MKKGTVWMGIGLLLIAAAFSLAVYNIVDEKSAQRSSEDVVEELTEEITLPPIDDIDKESALKNDEKLYEKYPELEMPTVEINGNRYIGILEIPAIGVKVPIMESWSYPNLKISPCRYMGSAYTGDLILAGHDYRSHFGNISRLGPGDYARFTDADGNVFRYQVAGTETLGATQVEEMQSGDWELTLFTCTYSGRSRTTVRFYEVK